MIIINGKNVEGIKLGNDNVVKVSWKDNIIWQIVNVKLTVTSNADTAINLFYTKKSYTSNKPSQKVSLSANTQTSISLYQLYKVTFPATSYITQCSISGQIGDCSSLF